MKSTIHDALRAVLLFAFALIQITQAETGSDAWLRYAPLDAEVAARYNSLPTSTVALGHSETLTTAQQEIVRGVKGMLGRTLRMQSRAPTEPSIVIGTLEQVQAIEPGFRPSESLQGDGYWLTSAEVHGFRASSSPRPPTAAFSTACSLF